MRRASKKVLAGAASAHWGPRCRLGRKLPQEGGREMIDGLSCLGPPPGLLSWRMRLGIPGDWRQGGCRARASSEWGSGAGCCPSPAPDQPADLGQGLGSSGLSFLICTQSPLNPQMVCALLGTGAMRGKTNHSSSFQRHSQDASQVRQPSQGSHGIWKATQAGVKGEHAWQKDSRSGAQWGSVAKDGEGTQREAGCHRRFLAVVKEECKSIRGPSHLA